MVKIWDSGFSVPGSSVYGFGVLGFKGPIVGTTASLFRIPLSASGYIHVFIYVCSYGCIYTQIYMHTHTHTLIIHMYVRAHVLFFFTHRDTGRK